MSNTDSNIPDLELFSGNQGPQVSADQTVNDFSELMIISDPLLGQPLQNSSEGTAPRTEIVFIESNVADIEVLRGGIGAGKEVYLLDANQDGLQQIATILAGRTGIDALHLVSHGSEASINLGSLLLDKSNIDNHQDELQAIGQSLSKDADILLYGCNIGAGGGKQFVDQLAVIIGADIAASNDLTGSAKLGGDWDLEVQQGNIEARIAADSLTLQNFSGVLAAFSGNISFNVDNKGNGTYKSTQDATAAAGSYTLTLDSDTAKTQVYGSYTLYSQTGVGFIGDGSTVQGSATLSFGAGITFQPQSIKLFNQASNDAGSFRVTGGSSYVTVTFSGTQEWQTVDLTSLGTVSNLVITKPVNPTKFIQLNVDDFLVNNVQAAAVAPTVSLS